MWYSSCLILSFSIEVLASFVPEAEVGMVAGIRGSCPDGSRLVSSDDVGHPLLMGVSLDLYDVLFGHSQYVAWRLLLYILA